LESETPKTDQWLLGGDCAYCRRQSYCHKRYTASSKRAEALIRDKLAELMLAKSMK
jgi:hypothetical protein